MSYFDTAWEDHEDDIQGETPLEELQEYYPHVTIVDVYEEYEDVWEEIEEEALNVKQAFNQTKKEKRARRNSAI